MCSSTKESNPACSILGKAACASDINAVTKARGVSVSPRLRVANFCRHSTPSRQNGGRPHRLELPRFPRLAANSGGAVQTWLLHSGVFLQLLHVQLRYQCCCGLQVRKTGAAHSACSFRRR
ncbi:unnamed protein product [Lampetra fluviatilis]